MKQSIIIGEIPLPAARKRRSYPFFFCSAVLNSHHPIGSGLYGSAANGTDEPTGRQEPLSGSYTSMAAARSVGEIASIDNDSSDESNTGEISISWMGPFGVVTRLAVHVDSVLAPGELVLTVDCHPRQQQLAYLAAADGLSRQTAANEMLSINARFQTLVEQLVSGLLRSNASEKDRNAKSLQCCVDLERITRDFIETARTYGRVIIRYRRFSLILFVSNSIIKKRAAFASGG